MVLGINGIVNPFGHNHSIGENPALSAKHSIQVVFDWIGQDFVVLPGSRQTRWTGRVSTQDGDTNSAN